MKSIINRISAGIIVNVSMLQRKRASEDSFLNRPMHCRTTQVERMAENEWYKAFRVSAGYQKTLLR
jgi:hypothetical protein